MVTYIVDINFIFHIGIDIDPVLFVTVNWNKINIYNVVGFVTIVVAVVIAIGVAIIAWIAFNARWCFWGWFWSLW